MPVTFRWLLEANACEVRDLSAAVAAQQTASLAANVAPVLMLIFPTLFLWRLLNIFLVVALLVVLLIVWRLLSLASSSSLSASGVLMWLLLLLRLRWTATLFNNLLTRRLFNRRWLWILIFLIIAFEVLSISLLLSSSRACRGSRLRLCLGSSWFDLFSYAGCLSVSYLLLLLGLIVELPLKEFSIDSL